MESFSLICPYLAFPYQQAEKLMVEDAACIPLWFGQNLVLIKPFVKGYRPNALGLPMLSKVSLDLPK